MKYDENMIETNYIEIGGTKIKHEKIPAGMNGPAGPVPHLSFSDDEEVYIEDFLNDPKLQKDYNEYVDESVEPDSDEVRAIKEEIEREQAEGILDVIDFDEEEE